MKRVLTIQDISCLGKCSLTTALPLISSMGVETVILPTGLLSTHTMFRNFTWKDLSDQLIPITNHWKEQNIHFDAIYTGYLGTEEEIDTVRHIISEFRDENTLVFVDPAMGDNGKLYPAFNVHYALKNAELCGMADISVPNITEACFMTGTTYQDTYDRSYVEDLLQKLVKSGTRTAALTGVSLENGKTGVMGYDTVKKEYFSYQNDRVPAAYHGTGDIFSSVVIGALMNGISWQNSLKIAADYTALTISETLKDPAEPWYGVNFESTIPQLISMLAPYRA